MDRVVQAQAQEGPRGRSKGEALTKNDQVPACCCWSHPPGHHGQEEPEARGQESTEGTSCQSRQGCQGSKGCPESYQECEVRCSKGWRKEINLLACSGPTKYKLFKQKKK